MLLFGNIGEFVETQESWMQYIQRFEQFLRANEIVDEGYGSGSLSHTIKPSGSKYASSKE